MKKCLVDYSAIKDNKVYITGDRYNHLAKALRSKVGDSIEVATPDMKIRDCIIEKIDDSTIVLSIKKESNDFVEPKTNVTLFLGILKQDKTELAIQKAVELGVKKIVLFTSQFTQVKPNENKGERLHKIALEACQQSGRVFVPEIEFTTYDKVLDSLDGFDLAILPYENEENKSFKEIKINSGSNIALIIGSAGGFSDIEIEKAKDRKAEVVTLGKRILRAETAVISSLSLVMYLAGDLE